MGAIEIEWYAIRNLDNIPLDIWASVTSLARENIYTSVRRYYDETEVDTPVLALPPNPIRQTVPSGISNERPSTGPHSSGSGAEPKPCL